MALVLKDRVRETSTTTGTGSFTLGGTSTGFQSFSVIGDGNTTYYGIVNSAAGEWEVGVGTYTASGTVLSRDTILESSNGGSAVDFSAGTKDVFVTYPAERSASTDTFASPPAIGSTTPAAGTFTTLTATGQTSLGGAAGSEGLRVLNTASSVNYLQAKGSVSGVSAQFSAQGADSNVSLSLSSQGAGTIRFFSNSVAQEQFRVAHTNSAVNYVQVTGAATGNAATISAQGSDSSVALFLSSKAAGNVVLAPRGLNGLIVQPDTSPVNHAIIRSANTGSSPTFSVAGSDTNIDLTLTPKGTGTVVANGPFTATGQTSLGGTAGSESLRATTPSVTGAWLQVTSASNTARIRSASDSGNTALWLSSVGSEIRFQTNSWATEQMRVSHTASAVNYVQVTGAATGGSSIISAQGSDANTGLQIRSKGSGDINLMTAAGLNQVVVRNGGNGTNFLALRGSNSGSAVSASAEGSDTNIDLTLTPKGTGAVVANGDFKMNSGYGSTAVAYGCRAWVNFNGTGTVAIRSSGNVSSITDNGTGDYTVNFSTAMPDANYAAFADSNSDPAAVAQQPIVNFKSAGGFATVAPTTSAFRFTIITDAGAAYDQTYISASAFR